MNNQSPPAYRIHVGVLSLIHKILHSLPPGGHLLLDPFAPACDFFFSFFFSIFIYLFGCTRSLLHHGGSFFLSFFFFSQLQHVGSSSLTRDWTQAPALGVWNLSHWTTREVPLACDFWQIHSSCLSGPILIFLRCLECPTLLYLAPDYLLLTKSQLRYYLPQKAFPDTYTHTHTSPRMNEAPLIDHLEPLTHTSIILPSYSSTMICWVCLQLYTINVPKSWTVSSF